MNAENKIYTQLNRPIIQSTSPKSYLEYLKSTIAKVKRSNMKRTFATVVSSGTVTLLDKRLATKVPIVTRSAKKMITAPIPVSIRKRLGGSLFMCRLL